VLVDTKGMTSVVRKIGILKLEKEKEGWKEN
jgi:hypothetical protein